MTISEGMKHLLTLPKTLLVSKTSHEFVVQVMNDLRAHDVETYEHCVRVSEMALQVAKELGESAEQQVLAAYSGLLHDVGKMKIPVDILNKPGRLTQDEFEVMKQHARFGVELIEPLASQPFFKQVSDAVMYHHERIDGQGYYQLSSDKIPHTSKIILVVDTVDAMTQDRAYRKGCSMEKACDELIRCTGTQFESTIVDAFLEIYKSTKRVASAA